MARRANNTPQRTSKPYSSSSADASSGDVWSRILLVLSAFALVLIGLVMVYSAGSIEAIHMGESPESYLVKQFMFAGIGIVGVFLAWKVFPYSMWSGTPLWIVYGGAILLLILTPIFGTDALGAKRWLFGIQPSEFAKIAFVLMMARILFDLRNGALDGRSFLIQTGVLIVLPLLFLYRTQSDLGTTLICFSGIMMVLWVGEVPLKFILALIAAGIGFAVLASLVGYRAERFVFLDPWSDKYDTGYQLIHSFYAFSEGGLFGVGLGNSREKFQYLPEAETDFIFAIIGEELGLVGAALVIVLFLVLLYAGLRIARSAPDNFGAMIAGSLTVMIVFQAFLNIGCVIGLFPTTGKPLPFVTSGGSSLIASMLMIGLILSVANASGAPNVYDRRREDLRVVRTQSAPPPPSRSASSRSGSRGGSASSGRRTRR